MLLYLLPLYVYVTLYLYFYLYITLYLTLYLFLAFFLILTLSLSLGDNRGTNGGQSGDIVTRSFLSWEKPTLPPENARCAVQRICCTKPAFKKKKYSVLNHKAQKGWRRETRRHPPFP